jgi:hypothetical protein
MSTLVGILQISLLHHFAMDIGFQLTNVLCHGTDKGLFRVENAHMAWRTTGGTSLG